MNIYEFINSPIIRELCEKKQHRFDTFEMAVIVAHSDKTLEDKITAYEELAYLYPDTSFCLDISDEEESICDFLKKRLVEMRKAKDSTEDTVYEYLWDQRIISPEFIKQKDVVIPFWFDPISAGK